MFGFLDPAEALLEFLNRYDSLVVRGRFLLWRMVYEPRTRTFPRRPRTISLYDWTSWLGYTATREKGHRPENRRAAYTALPVLTTLHLDALYCTPGEPHRIEGPLWLAGHTGYREGDDGQTWIPESFTYEPGHWFEQKDW